MELHNFSRNELTRLLGVSLFTYPHEYSFGHLCVQPEIACEYFGLTAFILLRVRLLDIRELSLNSKSLFKIFLFQTLTASFAK